MKFNVILAIDNKDGIGKNNTIPWHFSVDMEYFKKLTLHTETINGTNAIITPAQNATISIDSNTHYLLVDCNQSGCEVSLSAPADQPLGREIVIRNIGSSSLSVVTAAGTLEVQSGADSLSTNESLRVIAFPDEGSGKWYQF